ncbi:MAG: hypothetical protein ACRDPF_03990, partial [Streptosporangiaceae bacterium]
MAIFRAYAKVLEPGDPAMRIYEAGLRTCPGQPGLLLADVLRRTGGVYETTTPLPPQLRDDIREVAELTSDPELLAIADLTEVPVPLDHLRGLDPQTRIIIRTELCCEADEGARVFPDVQDVHLGDGEDGYAGGVKTPPGGLPGGVSWSRCRGGGQ